MMRVTSFLLLLVSIISRTSLVAASSSASSSSGDDGFVRLVAWMRRYGGRVDARMDVAEINGVRGIVALADIEDGAELLHCPWSLVIGSTGLHDQMQTKDMCRVVRELADEFGAGDASLWWPYLEHIQLPRLAAMWEPSASEELQGLSPSEDATRHLVWFAQTCGGKDDRGIDAEEMRSLVSFVLRASEVGMVPIYDLLNHHNGEKNAKLRLSDAGVQLVVVGGPVRQGQELYLSYGVKTASTMYRDYGFVEAWPCCWNWKDAASGDNFAFVMFPDGVAAINPTADFLRQLWNSKSAVRKPVAEFQASARRHMDSLPVEELVRFARAARTHLEGLPTTWREDGAILGQKKELLAQTPDANDAASRTAQDVISAIEYRSTFKKALESALISSETAARILMGQDL
uniref:SET domain-containing protein n=1 Tax=Corethron hystrix TaxID=216773 RepID=A0A7S1BN43_9STRA|mmetsp:Transcript_34950/g.80827  ORF Transcript_34950/g.80827 Transcript_34950/m.80827 type:complete len:403 (+) Transcript_34950:159-1367(+)